MRLRPPSVPRDATYSVHEGWWQVGALREGEPFGPWRTFRDDGSPLFEARFDARGRLQGAFRRFHPDGAVAREGRYEAGVLVGRWRWRRGTGDVFPSGDARAREVVVDYDDRGVELARVELDETGHEVDVVRDDAAGRCDALFADGVDGFVVAHVAELAGGAEPERGSDAFAIAGPRIARRALTPARFEQLHGVAPAPELQAWLAAGAGLRDADVAAPGNVVEHVIIEHQREPGRAVDLVALMCGAVPIARRDGRVDCVAVGERASGLPSDAVYPYVPWVVAWEPPYTRGLDELAFARALVACAASGAISHRALERACAALRGRIGREEVVGGVARAALGDRVLDDEEEERGDDEEGDSRDGFWFRRGRQLPRMSLARGRWVIELLCGRARAAARLFDRERDGGLSEERYGELVTVVERPAVAFYWLWRSWVFDDARLDALLELARGAKAQLTREIAALVGELAAGTRRGIGEVELGDVKREFRELVEPAVAEVAEEAPAPRARSFSDEDLVFSFDDGPPSTTTHDDEHLSLTETDPRDEPRDTSPGPAVVRHRLDMPGLAAEAAVLDWARSGGYEREGLLIDDELDVAALGLALRGDPRIVPYLARLAEHEPWIGARFLSPWCETGRADLRPLLPRAASWIAARDDLDRVNVAARIIACAGGPADAAVVASFLGFALDAMYTRRQGFRAALAQLDLEKALQAQVEALAALGVPDSLVPTLEGVVAAESHLVDPLRGGCARLLARAGRGLAAIVNGIEGQIDRDRQDDVDGELLLAAGVLGAAATHAQRLALLDLLDHDYDEGTLPYLALARCAIAGTPPDPETIATFRTALDEAEHNADEKRTRLLNLAARFPGLPGDLALPYVRTEVLPLHLAATRLLRARGEAVPPTTLYDPFFVAQLTPAARIAGLADERGIYRSTIALHLAEHPDPAARDALGALVRAIAARGDLPDEGPAHYELRWAVRALIAIGGAEDVLDELLRAPDRALAEPVLRYADRLGPEVARGMAHVFVEDLHWMRNVAKEWLAGHVQDPRVGAALAAHGLAVDDVRRDEVG